MRARSILEDLTASQVDESHGFPLVVRHNALPADYYAELASSFPMLDQVMAGHRLKSNRAYRMSASDALQSESIAPALQQFIDFHTSPEFFDEFKSIFGQAVERTHPDIHQNFGKSLKDFQADRRIAISKKNTLKAHSPLKRLKAHADVMLDAQISFNSPVQKRGSVRGAHLDNPSKLFVGLLYFREEGDDAGGDLSFYRRKPSVPHRADRRYRPEELETFLQVPYEANTLVLFANSPHSIHGVTARSVTDRPRRYMNIIGECYGGEIPDFFTAEETSGAYWIRAMRGTVSRLLR